MLFFFVFLEGFLVFVMIWRYFVLEEMEIGFFIVNIIKDMDVGDLVVRGVRVIFDDY